MKAFEKIRVTVRGYGTLHTLAPGFISVMIGQNVAQAMQPLANVYLSARIVDAIVSNAGLKTLIILAALLICINLILGFTVSAASRAFSRHMMLLWAKKEIPLYDKCRKIDYARLEDVKTHEAFAEILLASRTRAAGILNLVWALPQLINGIFTVLMSITLIIGAFTASASAAGFWGFVCKPWFALIIVAIVIMKIVFDAKITSYYSAQSIGFLSDFSSAVRVGGYFYNFFLTYQAGKDLKLYDLHDISMKQIENLVKEFDGIMKRVFTSTYKQGVFRQVADILMGGVFYAYVALKAIFGAFGVGSIVQYAGALLKIGSGISDLTHGFATLNANAEPLKKYFDFIDMPNDMHGGSLAVKEQMNCDHGESNYTVEFLNVSFKYPGSEVYALKNVSLRFHMGEKLAVVGENGSGKTTFIKLLCRLYDPTEGEIRLNGVDIQKYDYDAYLRIFSVVFQDFKLFSFSLGQNVAASVAYDEKKVRQCLKKAGFEERFENLPKGLDTSLYKDFDEEGVEISGGEAQKIALARALYKDAPFIILDEPTAALDPVAEAEVYSKFNDIVGDRTAIYISHRLSSCRFCNEIVVFDQGRIVQKGTHEELLGDENGKYAALWSAQAQYYEK